MRATWTKNSSSHPHGIRFDRVNIFSCKTSNMKHLILRGSFKSHRCNKFVFEKPVCIKIHWNGVNGHIAESWSQKLSDKDNKKEITSDFSLRNNKLAPC